MTSKAAQIEHERKYGRPHDELDPFNDTDDGMEASDFYEAGEDRDCSWCGGTAWDEDDKCPCVCCQGTGLSSHQIIW